MRDGDPWRFVLEDHLRLLVELGSIGLLRRLRGLDDQVLERLIAPARDVAAALHRFATEQRYEKVVWIAVIARPPEHHHRLFASLAAFAVFGPFVGDELGPHANLFPVGLDHLGHAFAVRVVRPCHRQVPQLDFETVGVARLG